MTYIYIYIYLDKCKYIYNDSIRLRIRLSFLSVWICYKLVGKNHSIQSDFQDLLGDSAYETSWKPYIQLRLNSILELDAFIAASLDDIDDADAAKPEPIDPEFEWIADAVHDVLEVYSDFHSRCISPIRRAPLIIFWFAFRPHNLPCAHRQRVAQQLKDAHVSTLDDSTLKLMQSNRIK